MSETLRQRMVQEQRLQARAQALQWADVRKKWQSNCPHRFSNGDWVLGLQHNFPDHQTRGICLHCQAIIAPRQWVGGGPNKVVVMPAHHLYPVVIALERQDHALATLRDVYEAAVDSFLRSGEMRRIDELDIIYAQARSAIGAQLKRDISDVSAFMGVK